MVESLREETLIAPKIFNWLKEQKNRYLEDEAHITSINEVEEQPLFNGQGNIPKDQSLRDEVDNIPVKEGNKFCSKWEGNNPKSEYARQEIDTILVQEENELPTFIVGEKSPRSQLETNATINYMECQELEVLATPI